MIPQRLLCGTRERGLEQGFFRWRMSQKPPDTGGEFGMTHVQNILYLGLQKVSAGSGSDPQNNVPTISFPLWDARGFPWTGSDRAEMQRPSVQRGRGCAGKALSEKDYEGICYNDRSVGRSTIKLTIITGHNGLRNACAGAAATADYYSGFCACLSQNN